MPDITVIRPAIVSLMAVLLLATAGCGKEEHSNNSTNPSKAVATAEGQTVVVKPKVDGTTNRTATP